MRGRVLSLLSCLLLPLALSAQAVELIPLNNYFVKNTIKLHPGLNCTVFSGPTPFNNYFGVAKTSTNAVQTPDFNAFTVLSMAAAASNTRTGLHIDSARRNGSILRVYSSRKQGAEQSFSTVPLTLMMTRRDARIKTYYFYENGKYIAKAKARKN